MEKAVSLKCFSWSVNTFVQLNPKFTLQRSLIPVKETSKIKFYYVKKHLLKAVIKTNQIKGYRNQFNICFKKFQQKKQINI